MRILLVGALSVNPERFLPLIKDHDIFGIWECRPKWKRSLDAGGPYKEIETISINEIKEKGIQLVWSLISPWDGLDTCLEIKRRYPELFILKQVQGGITPWWHEGKGNYDFLKLKKVLDCSDGLLFNSHLYRNCLMDQGVDIKNKPFLISNGMAYNSDILREGLDLPDWGKETHVALIGRNRQPTNMFGKAPVHVHTHSTTKCPYNSLIHREKYLGDVNFLRKKLISISEILKYKKENWNKYFPRYDAGLMHFYKQRPIDIWKGIDINVPGRINTYIMFGIPPIINERTSGIKEFLDFYGCPYIGFNSSSDLAEKVLDKTYLQEMKKIVLSVRDRFSMQEELKRVFSFIKDVI